MNPKLMMKMLNGIIASMQKDLLELEKTLLLKKINQDLYRLHQEMKALFLENDAKKYAAKLEKNVNLAEEIGKDFDRFYYLKGENENE